MNRLARLMEYARVNHGDDPAVTLRVLDAVRCGTERQLLTRSQHRRDLARRARELRRSAA